MTYKLRESRWLLPSNVTIRSDFETNREWYDFSGRKRGFRPGQLSQLAPEPVHHIQQTVLILILCGLTIHDT